MSKKFVITQLKRGLVESNIQRLSIAVVAAGFLILLRLVRRMDKRTVYSRKVREGETIRLRIRNRPGL